MCFAVLSFALFSFLLTNKVRIKKNHHQKFTDSIIHHHQSVNQSINQSSEKQFVLARTDHTLTEYALINVRTTTTTTITTTATTTTRDIERNIRYSRYVSSIMIVATATTTIHTDITTSAFDAPMVSNDDNNNDDNNNDNKSSNNTIQMSEYEKLRMQKIKRNEDRMKELGLFRSRDALLSASLKKKAAAKARREKKQSSLEQQKQELLPQRRSSRKRKSVVSYSQEYTISMHSDKEEQEEEQKVDDGDETNDDGDINSNSNNDDEKEEDYQLLEDENLDNNDDEEEELYLTVGPRKKHKQNKTEANKTSNTKTTRTQSKTGKPKTGKPKTKTTISVFAPQHPTGGLTLEYAKTSRSKCRKCRLPIEKNDPRVGMVVWIVGRNCVTWQCPKCILQNLSCVYEQRSSGKGVCKVTHIPFAKGQLKVGIRCHNATSYYHLDVVAAVLTNVVALMLSAVNDNELVFSSLTVDSIAGIKKLSARDLEKLGSVLETVLQSAAASSNNNNNHRDPGNAAKNNDDNKVDEAANDIASETVNSERDDDNDDKQSLAPSSNKKNEAKQAQSPPKVGVKTGAKGKVQWKFGGRTCYGTLLPSKETKTHCYARTHKGNVKTLAKGKDYWSMQ